MSKSSMTEGQYEVLLANGTILRVYYADPDNRGVLHLGLLPDGWNPEVRLAPGMWMAVRRLDTA
jgi:hypothetical protein